MGLCGLGRSQGAGVPRGVGWGEASCVVGASTVQGCVCPQAMEEEKEKGCQQRRLQEPFQQPSSTACSTLRLYCASLAGACFSINLGRRESLAEPRAAGKDLQLLCVPLAGLGLLQKCPMEGGGGEDGGGTPQWHLLREWGPSQCKIRGAWQLEEAE